MIVFIIRYLQNQLFILFLFGTSWREEETEWLQSKNSLFINMLSAFLWYIHNPEIMKIIRSLIVLRLPLFYFFASLLLTPNRVPTLNFFIVFNFLNICRVHTNYIKTIVRNYIVVNSNASEPSCIYFPFIIGLNFLSLVFMYFFLFKSKDVP